MTMKFTLCLMAILCALSAAALFWSGVKRQAERETERRRRKRLAVRQDREDASPVERRSSGSTRAARHLLRHRVVRAQLSPRCSRPQRPRARRARVRARLHARLCLTRAWPWHGQGALATDEVSETSERDLHFSDQDCSDTVNAADVGPKGAVAARWPESSCDSSPITDSGHHAEQHDQTRSQSRAGALQRPGSATTSPGTDKGSPVTAPTGNIRRHAVSSREVTAASRGIDGVEAEGHPVRRRSSVHRTSSNDSTTSEPATAPPTPVGRIGQGPIAPLAVPQQGASVRARDAVGGGGSQRDRDARMALLVGSHKDSKGSRQGLGQDLSLRQKVSPASRGRCNGSLPMILSETDLVSGCVTEPDVRPQSDNNLEAQRMPLVRRASRDQTPPEAPISPLTPLSSGARFYANVVSTQSRSQNVSASRGVISRSRSFESGGAAGSGSEGSLQVLRGDDHSQRRRRESRGEDKAPNNLAAASSERSQGRGSGSGRRASLDQTPTKAPISPISPLHAITEARIAAHGDSIQSPLNRGEMPPKTSPGASVSKSSLSPPAAQRQPSRTQPPKTQSSGARFYANVVNMREAQVARSGSGSQAEHPAPAAFRRNKNGSASRGMVSRLGSGESWVTGSGSWSSHGAAGSGSSGSSQALLGSSRALLGSSQASLSRNDNHSQRNGAPVDGGSVGPPRPSHRRGPRSSDPDDSTSLSPLQTNAIEGQGTMISPEQGLALLAGRH